MGESWTIQGKDAALAAERWGSSGPVVVALHAGVADRRSWSEVAELLAPACTFVAYDRRGFGATPTSGAPFSHLDDLLEVLKAVADGPVWLLGSSMGGGLALIAALVAPDAVRGVIVIGSAVPGAPDGVLDAGTTRLGDLLDVACTAEDLDEINRLETWLWLDGPNSPEGRVAGAPRDLMTEMNATILANEAASGPDDPVPGDPGVEVWDRLAGIRVPVTVACGDLDLSVIVERSVSLAGRLPDARHVILPGTAHLPQLEQPAVVGALVTETIGAG